MSQDSMPTLSVGNVFSAGFRLYRDRFKAYFFISVRATLWIILPFLVIIPIVIFSNFDYLSFSAQVALVALSLILSCYCFAKYIANSALISRLAFLQLIESPESVRESRRYVNAKILLFMPFVIFYSLFYAVAAIIVYTMLRNGLFILFRFIPQSLQLLTPIFPYFFVGITAIILLTPFLIMELPLAIEKKLNAINSISRSCSLSKGYFVKIGIIVIVTLLTAIPLFFLGQMAFVMVEKTILTTPGLTYPKFLEKIDPFLMWSFFIFLGLLMRLIVGLVTAVAIMPFWQTIKAVIYYDLRSRREGNHLQFGSDRTEYS